jgi:hypothetical protein
MQAVAALPSSVTSNQTLLSQILQYVTIILCPPSLAVIDLHNVAKHVINAAVSADSVPQLPQDILAETILQGTPSNQIDAPQPVVLAKINQTHVTVQQPNLVANVLSTHTWQGLIIYPIDHFLTYVMPRTTPRDLGSSIPVVDILPRRVPQNITWTANALGLYNLIHVATSASPGLMGILDNLSPVTVFAPSKSGRGNLIHADSFIDEVPSICMPNSQALQTANSTLNTDNSSLVTILANHVISEPRPGCVPVSTSKTSYLTHGRDISVDGQALYSNRLNASTADSVAGQPFHFSANVGLDSALPSLLRYRVLLKVHRWKTGNRHFCEDR